MSQTLEKLTEEKKQEIIENSSLTHKKQDAQGNITDDFVHDSYRNFFLAKQFAIRNIDMTSRLSDKGSWPIILFYVGLAEEGSSLVKKLISTHKPVQSHIPTNYDDRTLLFVNQYSDLLDPIIKSIEELIFIAECVLELSPIDSYEINRTDIAIEFLHAFGKIMNPMSEMPGRGDNFLRVRDRAESQYFKLAFGDDEIIKLLIENFEHLAPGYDTGTRQFPGYCLSLTPKFLAGIAGDDASAINYLRDLIQQYDGTIRLDAIDSLALINTPPAVKILEDILEGKYATNYKKPNGRQWNTLHTATKSLLSNQCPEATAVLDHLLTRGTNKGPNRNYFAFACSHFREYMNEGARRVMEKYRKDNDPFFRHEINRV